MTEIAELNAPDHNREIESSAYQKVNQHAAPEQAVTAIHQRCKQWRKWEVNENNAFLKQ